MSEKSWCPSFHKHHFFTRKNDRVLITWKLKPFFGFSPNEDPFIECASKCRETGKILFHNMPRPVCGKCLVGHIAGKGVTWRRVALTKKSRENEEHQRRWAKHTGELWKKSEKKRRVKRVRREKIGLKNVKKVEREEKGGKGRKREKGRLGRKPVTRSLG